MIPLLALPKVKLEVRLNNGRYEEAVSLAVKSLNTLMAGYMNTPNATGSEPVVTVASEVTVPSAFKVM